MIIPVVCCFSGDGCKNTEKNRYVSAVFGLLQLSIVEVH